MGILVATVLCGGIWLSQWGHPAKEQVKELEAQMSWHYIQANYLLRSTVGELLEWNFSEPLISENEADFRRLSREFLNVTDLFFSGTTVHYEWRNRVSDANIYLMNYELGSPLSVADIAELHQILQATRFISMDFSHELAAHSEFYDAMHSEKHEMVERVKRRLAMKY